jgi:hypothetical protein
MGSIIEGSKEELEENNKAQIEIKGRESRRSSLGTCLETARVLSTVTAGIEGELAEADRTREYTKKELDVTLEELMGRLRKH